MDGATTKADYIDSSTQFCSTHSDDLYFLNFPQLLR